MTRKEPKVVRTIAELRQAVAAWRREGLSVALVPTMGALHLGHLALAAPRRERGRAHASFRSSSTRASSRRARISPATRATRPATSPSSPPKAAISCGRRRSPTCTRRASPPASCRAARRSGSRADHRPHFFGGGGDRVLQAVQCGNARRRPLRREGLSAALRRPPDGARPRHDRAHPRPSRRCARRTGWRCPRATPT